MLFKDKKAKKGKFVGGYIPDDIFDYLALFVLVQGTNKSAAIRTIMQQWMDNSIAAGFKTEQLIRTLVEKIQANWSTEKDKGIQFNKYISDVRFELEWRGISKKHINEIIERAYE